LLLWNLATRLPVAGQALNRSELADELGLIRVTVINALQISSAWNEFQKESASDVPPGSGDRVTCCSA